jgi:alpha-tubulin suppressor-like RCC1 family protein
MANYSPSGVSLSLGAGFTCALNANGAVQCWGDNNSGQLGDGTTTSRASLGNVTGLSGVVGEKATAIAVGQAHTCAVLSDGSVKCWGDNSSGQLGDGTTTSQKSPVAVSGLPTGVKALALAAGFDHTCALLETGAVWCWGGNSNGELGNGTSVSRSTQPVVVSGLTGGTAPHVIALTASGQHTCALLETNAVVCWGGNAHGELGDGTTTNRDQPVNVTGLPSGAPVKGLTSGFSSTCTWLQDGSAWCWGGNANGQLGDGTTSDRSSAVQVSGLPVNTPVIGLAGGYFHTCALLATGGMRCWGKDSFGQLGDGALRDQSSPQIVSGLADRVQLAASGDEHICALMENGTLQCWGSNQFGQLGTGVMANNAPPESVQGISGGSNPHAIAAGSGHSCALLTDGSVDCWGLDATGQLGNGSSSSSLAPVRVSGLSQPATALASGPAHTCALLQDGTVACWGNNADGQLGDGTTLDRTSAVPVSGLSGVTALAAGTSHTCALLQDGTVACWGDNAAGQLGNGTSGSQPVTHPVVVSGVTNVQAIAAGGQHTCALVSGGGERCWGSNASGELGNGAVSYQPVSAPVTVSGLSSGVESITAGEQHSCALLTNGTIKCWGSNAAGQLGDATATDRLTPTQVTGFPGGATVSAVSAGSRSTCAMLSDGTGVCWGENATGQLGDGTLIRRLVPVMVRSLSGRAQQVAVGYAHACVVLESGAVMCWGSNGYGQLGTGSTLGRLTPQFVPPVSLIIPASPGLTFRVSWVGTDFGSGIQSYDVEYQVGNGAWTPWLTGTTQTGQDYSATADQFYVFRVRAHDRSGGTSDWVTSRSVQPK